MGPDPRGATGNVLGPRTAAESASGANRRRVAGFDQQQTQAILEEVDQPPMAAME